jgi:Dynamin family
MDQFEANVRGLLSDGLSACPGGTDGDRLRSEILVASEALQQRLKAAVIGLAKAGKSTIMNALLRRDMVATDDLICTSKVTCFRYCNQEKVLYHYVDGSVREAPLTDLHTATRRGGDEQLQRNLRFVEVLVPNPALQSFDLIDTPGGESHYISDSAETRAFLEQHGYEAIVYVFRQGLHQMSAELISHFRGSALNRSNPLNSIGVLSCIDRYWGQAGEAQPLAAAMTIVQRLRGEPVIQDLFFRILPVCGLLAIAGYTLDESILLSLAVLASLPEARLSSLLGTASRFVRQFPSDLMPAGAANGAVLLKKLDFYGIWSATEFIRRQKSVGTAVTRESVADELLRCSGISELETVLKQHFGARAFLIKWDAVRWKLQRIAFRVLEKGNLKCHAAAQMLLTRLEQLEAEEYVVKELKVLSNLYDRRLDLSPEESEAIKNILGENGTEFHERLGFQRRVSNDELLSSVRAILVHWQNCHIDPRPRSTETKVAEGIMIRSLERFELRLRDFKV